MLLRSLMAGLLVGTISTVATLALHYAGLIRTVSGGYLLMAAPALHIFVLAAATRAHAREIASGGGKVGYGTLLVGGLALATVAALVTAGGSWLYTTVIDPSFLPWIAETARAQLDAIAMEPEVRAARLAEVAVWTAPGMYAFQSAIGAIGIGLTASLIASAVFRGGR